MINAFLKQWDELKEYVHQLINRQNHPPELIQIIAMAHQDWQQSREQLNTCDQDMLEYAIFAFNAQERRYMSLLRQARQEKLTAWEINTGTGS